MILSVGNVELTCSTGSQPEAGVFCRLHLALSTLRPGGFIDCKGHRRDLLASGIKILTLYRTVLHLQRAMTQMSILPKL